MKSEKAAPARLGGEGRTPIRYGRKKKTGGVEKREIELKERCSHAL